MNFQAGCFFRNIARCGDITNGYAIEADTAVKSILLGWNSTPRYFIFLVAIHIWNEMNENVFGVTCLTYRAELDYVAMQYWAACASGFSVLIFLCLTLRQHSPHNAHSLPHRAWGAKFSLSCIFLCASLLLLFNIGKSAILCLLAVSVKVTRFGSWNICLAEIVTIHYLLFFFFGFFSGMATTLKLLQVLCHGFAAVKLVLHLLNNFPSCASIGMCGALSSPILPIKFLILCCMLVCPLTIELLLLVLIETLCTVLDLCCGHNASMGGVNLK